MGILFLGTGAAGSGYYNNGGTASTPQMTDPNVAAEFHNYIKQKWRNGYPLVVENPSGLGNTANGDGFVPSQAGIPTRWAYNDVLNWYESPANQADKRMILSSPTQDLPAGEDLCFDLAVIYARDSVDTSAYSSVTKLKRMTAEVQQFFDTQSYNCMNSNIGTAEYTAPELRLFPNPVNDQLKVQSNSAISKVEIYTLAGERLQSTILEGSGSHHISLSGKYRTGLYICTIYFESGGALSRKIFVR